MKRRQFIKGAAVCVVCTAIPKPIMHRGGVVDIERLRDNASHIAGLGSSSVPWGNVYMESITMELSPGDAVRPHVNRKH